MMVFQDIRGEAGRAEPRATRLNTHHNINAATAVWSEATYE
ncbi:MAG TPA: hypothetical protein VFB76_15465 [Candidatus Angelobacter sp.]|nr:hypothetical protein [Candidatus Angelobacter sp.]